MFSKNLPLNKLRQKLFWDSLYFNTAQIYKEVFLKEQFLQGIVEKSAEL